MSEEVKVEKINIKIGDVEIALTIESVKELKKVLNELFGGKEFIYISNPYVIIPSCPVPYFPHNPYKYWEPTWYYYDTSPSTSEAIITINSTSYSSS